MVLPYLRFAFAPSAFDVFCQITDIHKHAALGAWLFFGVCLRDGTGLGCLFVSGLGLGTFGRGSHFLLHLFWPARSINYFLLRTPRKVAKVIV
jgi:hypothetical protein